MGVLTKLIFTVYLAGCIFVNAVQAQSLGINCTKTQISLTENSNNSLTTITANKAASFKVLKETGGGHFVSITQNGTLSISTTDAEKLKQAQINVTITATDNKTNQSCTLQIDITDLNDNAPSFPNKKYTVNLPDNPPKGKSVINVTATDGDLTSPNNGIKYSLAGTRKDDFAIDETGHVTVKVDNVSSAALHTYSLTVFANDTGSPQLSGKAALEICVGNCGSGGFTPHTWSTVCLIGSLLYVMFSQKL